MIRASTQGVRRSKAPRVLLVAAILLTLAASLSAEPAQAAFPGTNGKISFSRNNDVFTMDANGSNQTNRSNNAAADGTSAFSPDGTKIVFRSDRDGKDEIYLMNADGTGQTRLTNAGNPVISNASPAFSPDGTRIVFHRTVAGSPSANADVFVMDAAPESATNQPVRLTDNAARDEDAVFSPNGQKIAFSSTRDGNDEIYIMDADGGNETRLTNSAGTGIVGIDRFPNFSPAGTRIAFASGRDGNTEVYMMAAEDTDNDGNGESLTRLTDNAAFDQQPAFSPDGTKIVFESGRTPAGIFVMDADPSTPDTGAAVTSLGSGSQPDWGPADTTPPVTTINTGPSGPFNGTSTNFTFTSTEGGTFQCKLDNAAFAPCTSPHLVSSLGEGPHTFQVKAIDASGNEGAPATRSFTVDTIAPNTTITGGPSGSTNDNTPSFTFDSSEANSTFQCRLTRSGETPDSFAACSSSDSFGPLTTDGGYTFEVKATDAAGNEDSTPESRSFTVDATAPETTITGGPSGPTNDNTPTFEFSSEAGATFQCSLDGAVFSDCTSPRNLTLGEGPHTFRVRAIDAVGNVDPSPGERAFTVDTAAPTVVDSSLSPANLAKNIARATNISATFSEAINEGTLVVTLVNSKNSTAVTAIVKLSADGKKVTIDPVGKLAKKTKYIVTIKGGSSGVKDLAGNALVADKTWFFTTKKK